MTADELWRGVLAETGAGGRKGRGKRTKRKLKRDLNRGQKIGEGEKSASCTFITVLIRVPSSVSVRFTQTVLKLKSSCGRSINL